MAAAGSGSEREWVKETDADVNVNTDRRCAASSTAPGQRLPGVAGSAMCGTGSSKEHRSGFGPEAARSVRRVRECVRIADARGGSEPGEGPGRGASADLERGTRVSWCWSVEETY